jgi:hypothetical protein
MPVKEELIAEAKVLGISLPTGKLSKAELEALISDHKLQAKEVGDADYKLKPDPMTGLSGLTRDRLNRILDNLNEKGQYPEKAPGKASHLRTKGHVLLAIREKMTELNKTEIRYGKLKTMKFQDIQEMPDYVKWLLRDITNESHPHMISMAQYMKLYLGLEKPDKKSEEEEDSSGPELMKDQPEWVEPDWTEIHLKKENPGKINPRIPPKPEWDGEASTWEDYRTKCQTWILTKGEASSSSTVKPEKTPGKSTTVKLERTRAEQ